MGIIHFLNVNEGDCTWIHHASGRNTIIDVSAAAAITEFASASGNHQQKNYPVNPIQYLKDFGVSTIFRFILTHPDMDHMDGMKSLFDSFSINTSFDCSSSCENIKYDGENTRKKIGNFIKKLENQTQIPRYSITMQVLMQSSITRMKTGTLGQMVYIY